MPKVKDALKSENFDAMKTAEEQLTEVWHGVSSDIYAKAREKTGAGAGQATGAGPQEPPHGAPQGEPGQQAPGKQDNVVDADFEVVDENKKK